MRGHPGILGRLRVQSPSDLGISTVTLYELYSGVERCRAPDQERKKVETLVGPMLVVPFDADAAEQTARVRWILQQLGQLIGPYDLMLAGQALSLGVRLVTHNVEEFRRVAGLVLEDWQTAGP